MKHRAPGPSRVRAVAELTAWPPPAGIAEYRSHRSIVTLDGPMGLDVQVRRCQAALLTGRPITDTTSMSRYTDR